MRLNLRSWQRMRLLKLQKVLKQPPDCSLHTVEPCMTLAFGCWTKHQCLDIFMMQVAFLEVVWLRTQALHKSQISMSEDV